MLKNLCRRECIPSLITNRLSMTYSFHALINITENIRKALHDRNIGCGVFLDFEKAFDTVKPQDTVSKFESLCDLRSFK